MNKRIISINIFTALIATSCWGAAPNPQPTNELRKTVLTELPDTLVSTIIEFVVDPKNIKTIELMALTNPGFVEDAIDKACRQLVEHKLKTGYYNPNCRETPDSKQQLAVHRAFHEAVTSNKIWAIDWFLAHGMHVNDANLDYNYYDDFGRRQRRTFATPLQAARDLGLQAMADLLEKRGGIVGYYK